VPVPDEHVAVVLVGIVVDAWCGRRLPPVRRGLVSHWAPLVRAALLSLQSINRRSQATQEEEGMSTAPFIYIGTNRMKAGMLEAYKRNFMPELLQVVEANEPRILGFHGFADEEGTEIVGVQIHPDANSMLEHMKVVRERITMAYGEYLEATTAIQVLGSPNDAMLEMIRRMATPGVSVSVKPVHLGGFTRLESA
jgi:hypothetical protein